ncbi:hypothetical protein [Nocardia thailandica]|uniref:hypothetical protein n=1 Tax=Nocardia thailandica TaxID=257275 RepID=UPI0002DFDAEA|nr:hypothetical protein [Nocardia thailandica]
MTVAEENTVPGVQALLDIARRLTEQAAEVAASLRFAADAVAAGRPSDADLDDAVRWCTEARGCLDQVTEQAARAGGGSADPHGDLASGIATLQVLQAAESRKQALAVAHDTVARLRQSGLDNLIPGVLNSLGFASESDLGPAPQAGDPDPPQHRVEQAPAAPPSRPPSPPAEAKAAPTPTSTGKRPSPNPVTPVDPVHRPAAEPLTDPSLRTPEPAQRTGAPAGRPIPAPGRPVRDAAETSDQRSDAFHPPAPATPARIATPAPPTQAADRLERTAPRAFREPASTAVVEDFPWDVGAPPQLVELIATERDALAVLVAREAGETRLRQQILESFCAAFHCTPGTVANELPQWISSDTEIATLPSDEARILIAAVTRIGMTLGYFPTPPTRLIDRCAFTRPGLRAVFEAAEDLVRRGFRWAPDAIGTLDNASRWQDFGTTAQVQLTTLQTRSIKYELASKVLHRLVTGNQVAGAALNGVIRLAAMDFAAADDDTASWDQIRRAVDQLYDDASRAALIDATAAALATGNTRKIIGPARRTLEADLGAVGRFLLEFLALRNSMRTAPASAEANSELAAAIRQCGTVSAPATVGEVALERLLGWLRDPAGSTAEHGSVESALLDALDPIFEIDRDELGRPERTPTGEELALLLSGRAPKRVVRGYLEAGNIHAARRYAERLLPADAGTADMITAGIHAARQRHQQGVEELQWFASRIRAIDNDELARVLTVESEALRRSDPERYDLAFRSLTGLVQQGRTYFDNYRAELTRRLDALDPPPTASDRARIERLIAQDSEVVADDFLVKLRAGEQLPAAEQLSGDDFTEFFPVVVAVAAEAERAGTDITAAVRRHLQAPVQVADRQLDEGIRAWHEVRRLRRGMGSESFRLLIARILRMIGLAAPGHSWIREISTGHKSGFATFTVRAMPIDRSYIPALGTNAHGSYDLTLVWEPRTPVSLMQIIGESRRTQPNIVLYFSVLSPERRTELRTLSHTRGYSPIFVDDAVAAWLTTRQEPGWRYTQRVTLPFTTFNPYTPFAGGEVPEEVFVGRQSERAQIEDLSGPMFVYGGRQLGKSALLRRVQGMFTDDVPDAATRTGRVAVYLDLKAAGIGESVETPKLWGALAEELKGARVTDLGIGSSEATVAAQIRKWLDADPTNRLLLLLDEADNFLIADYLHGKNTGKGGEFPTLQGLKKLMADSHRRLKPVFAGLHQVQRFQDIPNTPMGHGGQDIKVGPLRTLDAYELVVTPLRALGYSFRSQDVVWRLLLYTNYQASLVQILCNALADSLRKENLPPRGGRIEITEQHVDQVFNERSVRELIVQRFRWTTNLDARYRVIALVVAVNSLGAEPGASFSVPELREQCEFYWSTGFSVAALPETMFAAYLDEMVGLGVLYRVRDEFGLRSPYIIGLLGSKEALERELLEASTTLELPHEYNPTMNRRVLGKAADVSARRSSLTDADLTTLLQREPPSAPVHIVTGSLALGIDRVAESLLDAAAEQGLPLELCTREAISGGGISRGHLLVDLHNDSGTVDLRQLVRRLGGRNGRSTAIVIVGPDHLPVTGKPGRASVVSLRRWSLEELRFWHDSPFDTPDLRARLHRVTSGWPELVEAAMSEVNRGAAPVAALSSVAHRVLEPDGARKLLADTGVDVRIARAWAECASTRGEFGLADPIPVETADLREFLTADSGEVLARLRALGLVDATAEGWVLDRLVLTAALCDGL